MNGKIKKEMKQRIPTTLNRFIANESKVSDHILELIDNAKQNPQSVKAFVELTRFIGLSPNKPKNLFKVKDIVMKYEYPEDAMEELMYLQESHK